jgi:hypothetical protein
MAGVEDLTGADLQAHSLGKLLQQNPEVYREAQRLALKVNPKLRIPEIELEDQIAKSEAKNKERTDKLEEELIAERVARRKTERDAQIAALGLEIAEVEKIIVDEKCSYETAMKLAQLQRQTAEPTAGDHNFVNAPGTPVEMRPEGDVRKLSGASLRRWSADQAHKMIDQLRGQRRVAR